MYTSLIMTYNIHKFQWLYFYCIKNESCYLPRSPPEVNVKLAHLLPDVASFGIEGYSVYNGFIKNCYNQPERGLRVTVVCLSIDNRVHTHVHVHVIIEIILVTPTFD